MSEEISQNAPAIEKIIEKLWKEKIPGGRKTWAEEYGETGTGYPASDMRCFADFVSLRVSKEASLRELEKINEEADRMYGKGSLVSEFIVHYRQRRELERPTKT